jgi:MtfA peptidase
MEQEPVTIIDYLPFLIIILIFFLIATFRPIRSMIRYIRYKNLNLILPEILPPYRQYLVKHFPFYYMLTSKGQRIFEGRVQKFIEMKEFVHRGDIREVTDEMKVLIAGSAIQLTFGYPDIYFDQFGTIIIYPDEYYSMISKEYHKGEVNAAGIIVLSWKSLKEGFSDQTDGIHLGLHEMAHALRIIKRQEDDTEENMFFDSDVMRHFDIEASHEMNKMLNTEEPTLFREYAAANSEEFFAVAVEVFFEKPEEFFNYNPRLYDLMAAVLKMDLRKGGKIPFNV